MLEIGQSRIRSAASVRAELAMARRVMSHLLSDSDRSTVQEYIADLERALSQTDWNTAVAA